VPIVARPLPSPTTDAPGATATRRAGLRGIAVIEAGKGVVAVLAATGVALHERLLPVVIDLASHLHLNPASDRPLAIVHALSARASGHLRLLAAGVLVYATLRVVEAVGLWHGRAWALWVGGISAAIYLPFEFALLLDRPGALPATLLALNGAIAAYLIHRAATRREAPP
jgi:uncharacterized membrane protein (DUF2068 family)